MNEQKIRQEKHRLNNILASISGQAQLLLIRENLSDAARERIGSIRRSADELTEVLTSHFDDLLENGETSNSTKRNEQEGI